MKAGKGALQQCGGRAARKVSYAARHRAALRADSTAAGTTDCESSPCVLVAGEMDGTHAQPYAARLARPDGADGTVWLLAKHNNSARGAEEAAALVRDIKPSKVVVQLDASTLHALLDYHKVRWHSEYPLVAMAIAKWTPNLLKEVLFASGDLRKRVDAYPGAFKNAVYADSLPHLWGPVIDAAVAVGAEIVVADRASEISKSRFLAARKLSADGEKPYSLMKIVSQQMGPDANKAADAAIERAIARHGCLLTPQSAGTKSAAYMLIAEAAIFGKVRPENLAAVRACKALEADIDRELELIAAAPTLRAAGGEPAPAVSAVKASREPRAWLTSPVARALYGERELLFARALQPPSAPERDIVGIFGPDHVAGIARAWRHARSPESDALAAEYMLPAPSVSVQSYTVLPAPITAVTLGVGALTARMVLKSARPLRTASLVAGAGVAVPVAGLYLANRALGALLKADGYLRTVDQVRSRSSKQLGSQGACSCASSA